MSDLRLFADFMKDFWSYIKKYHEPEPTDDWWEEMYEEADRIARKHDHELCTTLIIETVKWIGRKERHEQVCHE